MPTDSPTTRSRSPKIARARTRIRARGSCYLNGELVSWRVQEDTDAGSARGMPHAGALAMSDVADRLRQRTLGYTVRIIQYCKTLPNDWVAREVGRQLLGAGMGVSGNYWSACRG